MIHLQIFGTPVCLTRVTGDEEYILVTKQDISKVNCEQCLLTIKMKYGNNLESIPSHRHKCSNCEEVFPCPNSDCNDDSMDMYPTDSCPKCDKREEKFFKDEIQVHPSRDVKFVPGFFQLGQPQYRPIINNPQTYSSKDTIAAVKSSQKPEKNPAIEELAKQYTHIHRSVTCIIMQTFDTATGEFITSKVTQISEPTFFGCSDNERSVKRIDDVNMHEVLSEIYSFEIRIDNTTHHPGAAAPPSNHFVPEDALFFVICQNCKQTKSMHTKNGETLMCPKQYERDTQFMPNTTYNTRMYCLNCDRHRNSHDPSSMRCPSK